MKNKPGETKEAVYQALRFGSLTTFYLLERTGLPRASINHALKQLIREGRVEIVPSHHTNKNLKFPPLYRQSFIAPKLTTTVNGGSPIQK